MKSVIMRSIVIFAVTGVALVIPNFTVFLDIAGAIGAGVIGFILPPLMYNEQFKDTITPRTKYFNLFILGFGIVGIIISLTTSFIEIAKGKV